jgi:hypothetical protein
LFLALLWPLQFSFEPNLYEASPDFKQAAVCTRSFQENLFAATSLLGTFGQWQKCQMKWVIFEYNLWQAHHDNALKPVSWSVVRQAHHDNDLLLVPKTCFVVSGSTSSP